MRIARAALLLSLALPLAACTDPSDPMATATDLPALAASLESQGAIVERYDGFLAVWWWDPETELLAAHIYRDPYSICTPNTPFELYWSSIKDVISSQAPEDADLVRELIQTPEISIKVWHSTNGAFNTVALRCAQPIASGVGKIIYTDNDALAWQADRMRANAFGYTAQATLEGPDGERYHYNGIFRVKWQPNSADPDGSYNILNKVNLVRVGQ